MKKKNEHQINATTADMKSDGDSLFLGRLDLLGSPKHLFRLAFVPVKASTKATMPLRSMDLSLPKSELLKQAFRASLQRLVD